ncbi:MAG: hypothetical protein M3R43_08695 [Acidobacteriota bacterium]|nr:hypothetical protein [Acidobacteriota bacterium]
MPHPEKTPRDERRPICAVAVLCLTFGWLAAQAQNTPAGTSSAPVVDSATPGPVALPPRAPAIDASVESSPVPGVPISVYVPAPTEIAVRLQQSADSGHARNGDRLKATLASAVKMSNGHMLPAGTPVAVTVLAVAAAGKLESRGELTLQVTHVGPVRALPDARTFFGQKGRKDIADSAPAKGTEASVAAGTVLRFHVPVLPR